SRRFAQRVDSMKPVHLGFEFRGYPEDVHSLTPMSLADGLRFAFEPVSTRRLPIMNLAQTADSATAVRAFRDSERHYAEAARPLLLPEDLPEVVVRRAASFALNRLKNPAFAVALSERNVSLRPKSPSAHASLADALLAKGDTAAAVDHLRMAAQAALALCE